MFKLLRRSWKVPTALQDAAVFLLGITVVYTVYAFVVHIPAS